MRPLVGIATPGDRASNNGNWQTARRWSGLLAPSFRTTILDRWRGEPLDLLIALHARRSAASIAEWHAARRGPLVVVLTGTDLYRDLPHDTAARDSVARADRLVVLQDRAPASLPAADRGRCVVCFQSCRALAPLPKTRRHLRALMVGHLRDEKSPGTYFDAARRLAGRADIRLDHIGAALDPALGEAAERLTREVPTYRWLGARGHAETRRRIRHAHLLVHPSRMEGGAHVIAEAVRSGTAVLASSVEGNVGMMGEGYRGYFEAGDDAGLAEAIARLRDDPAALDALREQGDARAGLFEPATERALLIRLVTGLLQDRRSPGHAGNPRKEPA